MTDAVDTRAPRNDSVAGLPVWALWTLVAYAATVFHVLIDMHIGLFGEISDQMSVVKGFWGLTQSVLLAWWMLVTMKAANGNRVALKSSLVLTGVLAFLVNGVIALVAAPPASDAAPWQDLTHMTAAVAGLMALRSGVRQFGERPWPRGGRSLVISIGLVLVNAAFGAPLTLENLSS